MFMCWQGNFQEWKGFFFKAVELYSHRKIPKEYIHLQGFSKICGEIQCYRKVSTKPGNRIGKVLLMQRRGINGKCATKQREEMVGQPPPHSGMVLGLNEVQEVIFSEWEGFLSNYFGITYTLSFLMIIIVQEIKLMCIWVYSIIIGLIIIVIIFQRMIPTNVQTPVPSALQSPCPLLP